MNEKDKQIERLFDDYASSLEPNTRLADKAMQTMRSQKQTQKLNPKRRTALWLGLAAACGAAVIAVISVTVFLGRSESGGTNNSAGDHSAVPAEPIVKSYSISEVKASKADKSFAAEYINTALPSGAQIFNESYYACYIKNTNEFVYLKAVLGVSYNGGNIQMSVVAERSGYAGDELSREYKYLMRGTGYRYYVEYVNGEYVTMAYRKSENYTYYVSAMGNVNGAQDIAKQIIDIN